MAAAPVPVRDAVSKKAHRGFSRGMLNVGFLTGLTLAIACFVLASLYMFRYLNSADSLFNDIAKATTQSKPNLDAIVLLIQGRLVAARFSLLSCGILTGLSLGLIGFCLFLVGATGEMDAQAEVPNARIAISRLAPGALVLLCATILIGVCATHPVTFETSVGASHDQAATTNGGKAAPNNGDSARAQAASPDMKIQAVGAEPPVRSGGGISAASSTSGGPQRPPNY